jgi:hypothetical protein
MFHDVQVCINNQANFAAALTLGVYTDALGGLINGNLTQSGVRANNYRTFLERMGYSPTESERYYKDIRCGLAHQYFIKGENTVADWSPSISKRIYELNGIIYFFTENYFREFKDAYRRYKNELLSGVGNLQSNFDQALTGSSLPYDVVSYFNPAAVRTSLSTSQVSGSVLIFVPLAGPMSPPGATS